jgi:hypothetical protein
MLFYVQVRRMRYQLQGLRTFREQIAGGWNAISGSHCGSPSNYAASYGSSLGGPQPGAAGGRDHCRKGHSLRAFLGSPAGVTARYGSQGCDRMHAAPV